MLIRLGSFSLSISLAVLICIAMLPVVHAQAVPPDFSVPELILQQQRERELQRQMQPAPDVRFDESVEEVTPQALVIPDESPCFMINELVLIGEQAEKFQWAVGAANMSQNRVKDPAIRRCLGSEGINIVMERVQNAIIEKGFITSRIVAAPQDLNSGTLELTLIPGTIRSIRWSDDSDTATSWRSALPMREGDLLNLRDIEQALEGLKRVPSAEADIQIEPADEVGQSDLVLSVKQGFPFRFNFSLDDGGSKSTGRYQGAMTVSYDNWLTQNDLFYVSFNKDMADRNGGGSKGHSIHYSIPIHGDWLASINSSSYKYHQQVAGITQDYVYSGDSNNLDLSLSRRMYRNSTMRLNGYVKGFARKSHNFIDGTEIQVQRRRTAGWETGLDYRHYIRNSILNANLSYRRGTGANDSMRAPEELSGTGTSRMQIISLNANLSTPFSINGQRFRYYGSVKSQWSKTPLVAQDQFSIGGRYTVRGFDGEYTLMGERGLLIRNDLGWVIPDSAHELYIGLDYAHVSGPSVAILVGNELAGGTLGLRGSFNWWKTTFSYDIFGGMPIYKPENFQAADTMIGFNLNYSF